MVSEVKGDRLYQAESLANVETNSSSARSQCVTSELGRVKMSAHAVRKSVGLTETKSERAPLSSEHSSRNNGLHLHCMAALAGGARVLLQYAICLLNALVTSAHKYAGTHFWGPVRARLTHAACRALMLVYRLPTGDYPSRLLQISLRTRRSFLGL